MTHDNPIPDAELAEVKRLYAAVREALPGGDPRQPGQYIVAWNKASGAIMDAFPFVLARLEELQAYRDAEVARRAKADCYDRICEHLGVESNVLGAIADKDARLAAAERERGELRQTLEGTQRDVITLRGMVERNAAKLDALPARDAQQRREGAAAALRTLSSHMRVVYSDTLRVKAERIDACDTNWFNPEADPLHQVDRRGRDAMLKALGVAEWLEKEADREGYGTYERSVEGMREEAADLRAEAKRLREGGE